MNKQRCPATTPPVLDVSAKVARRGSRSPTELKMRSVIIAISVNLSTFPANRNLRATAKSVLPRAKSFIRSISQINYNRQKFSISMTSEIRKCPKSPESDRNSGFLHLAIEREGAKLCNVQAKDAHAQCGSTVEIFLTALLDLTFIFEKNRFFFGLFGFSHWTYEAGTGTNPSDDHISAILAARKLKVACSSSDWPSAQPGIHDSVFACHHSELFRGTKKVKIQNCQIGLKFSNLAWSVSRTRKKFKAEKKFFFFGLTKICFFFLFDLSKSFDGIRSTKHDILLVDEVSVGLALKLASLGADKPPANNT